MARPPGPACVPRSAKWQMGAFDAIEVEGAGGENPALNETLATFVASAAIHLATTHGWEAFEFQVALA
jgi:hypothetical protein